MSEKMVLFSVLEGFLMPYNLGFIRVLMDLARKLLWHE